MTILRASPRRPFKPKAWGLRMPWWSPMRWCGPICVAATACQGFCRAELDTFREVLGPDVSVEREEHIVQGDRRCAYRIALPCLPPEPPRRRVGRGKREGRAR